MGYYSRPGRPMISASIPSREDSLRRSIAREQAELALIEQAKVRIEGYGEDDFEVGAVITFTRTFDQSKTYHYAAVKDDRGLWSTTGPHSPNSYTWAQLIAWLCDCAETVEVWYATDLRRVNR